MGKITVTAHRGGKTIRYKTEDKGKPGKTPKSEQWYEPETTDTGWEKNMARGKRRWLMLEAHGGDELASARAMQSLANVTTDRVTRREAQRDADYFFKVHNQKSKGLRVSGRMPRISPRFRRLK